jgi:3-oxoacyl-[acyl-carrier protein] reductase
MSGLTDKVAIVTGASKGIGSGIATALAAAAARVAVNYSSNRTGAERVAQAIIDSRGEAIAIGADVSKAADVARLFKEVDTAFGRLDVVIDNAGVFRFGALAEITEESFHVDYNINVLGSILMVQEAIKRLGWAATSRARIGGRGSRCAAASRTRGFGVGDADVERRAGHLASFRGAHLGKPSRASFR